MGYLHIDNLYKNQTILKFRECYAMEKIHGTSAHIAWKDEKVEFFSGGENLDRFKALFNEEELRAHFIGLGQSEVTIFGEAYGGKQQGQSWRYGTNLKFVAFDVNIGNNWLVVPHADSIVTGFGLEFVHYEKVSTDIEVLNAQRDASSMQAKRNDIEGDQPREGVVLRPLIEVTLNNGDRVIAKHKRDDERETAKPRKVDDVSKLELLAKANEIALEWATETRLDHVLDKLPQPVGIEQTGDVLRAMVEDVMREGAGEVLDSKEARKAISAKTAAMFKARVTKIL